MYLIVQLVCAITIILLARYHWSRRHLYIAASQLPGPTTLPIVGNGLLFNRPSDEILKVLTNVISSYTSPSRLWIGHYLMITYTKPEQLEKILLSTKLTHKHDFYDKFVKIYIGNGLVSNSGEIHKKHRRVIQPMLSLKFLYGQIEIFHKHMDVFLNRLDVHEFQRKTFDVHRYVHECFVDIIGELILGTEINSQQGKNHAFMTAATEMYQVCYDRMVRPWLHPDCIYSLTKGKKDQDRIIKETTTFIKEQLKRAELRNSNKEMDGTNAFIIDQISKRKELDVSFMNDTDFLYHMYTLYVASEDTLTIIGAMLIVCFGMYPEYQQIAAEEIRCVLGENTKEATYDDLKKLTYLEMCIKEVLRLIPIAPMFVRKALENVEIDNMIIPKDAGILISVFNVHRNPDHWELPEDFHPDHFLPEVVSKRHPYAFIPFSGGQRSCVGQVFAYNALKIMAVNLLQRFEIEADGKFSDIELMADITVRSKSGYKIRLKKRIWN